MRYNEVVKDVVLSGPTSFAPIIRRSMRHVKESGKKFHILVIIADGQMEVEGHTVSAIIDASKLPLSIVLVGVGDGLHKSLYSLSYIFPSTNTEEMCMALL